MKESGVCLEEEWPYNKRLIPNNIDQGPPPKKLSKAVQVTDYISIDSTDLYLALCLLDRGFPLICTIPVYKSWYEDGWVESTGEIFMPLPYDLKNPSQLIGFIAICIVGYNLKNEAFIFRNSWGDKWAELSVYGPGIGQLPWNYLLNKQVSIFLITNVLVNKNISNKKRDYSIIIGNYSENEIPPIVA